MKNFFKQCVVFVLEAEARAVLRKYKPKIIAITGSVGKTTTKDAIYTVLSEKFFVRQNIKSFNSTIGLPLTILDLPNAWSNPFGWIKNFCEGLMPIIFTQEYPEWLILEVGADVPGGIEKTVRWLKPDITVMTKMSKVPVHVEFFGTPAAILHEKSHLARALKPSGTLILNADDDQTRDFATLAPASARNMSYAYAAPLADLKASEYAITYDAACTATGISYKLTHGGTGTMSPESAVVTLPGVLGMQSVYTTLAAAAVGVALGMTVTEIAAALAHHELTPGRMRLLAGVRGSTIIDDTYNSSPVAAHEALDTLAAVRPTAHGRRIAVLGDMLELGEFSSNEHRLAGEHAARVAGMLVTVGVRSRTTADEARSRGLSADRVHSFDDSVAAGEFLARELAAGDIVLCKGSQGVRMEKAVAMILADPSAAPELLARQDEAWQKR